MFALLAPLIGQALGGFFATAVGQAVVQIGMGVAASALGRALQGQERPDAPTSAGIRTEVTLEGGTLPQTLILGRYATGGTVVAPFYAAGRIDDTPNGFRFKVVDLADHPLTSLRAVWVDDTRFSVANHLVGDVAAGGGASPDPAARPRWTEDPDTLRVRFFDGTQTAADGVMVSHFADHPERPWTADMVGRGVAYLRTMHRFDPELYGGEPALLAEVEGSALYDRRRDGSAGGTGAQRFAEPATWAYTQNPIVMVEAILRGLTLRDGTVWGLGVAAADLPPGSWTAAMNACDVEVEGAPRYRAGFEARLATAENGGDDPFDVIDELLKACAGAVADCGGTWVARSGPPGAAVAAFSDDDLSVSHPQDFEPHRGVTEVWNAVRATFPDPSQMWRSKEAPIRREAAAEAQDGERLVAELNLLAVWHEPQVQQLQRAYLADARRMRRHTVTLPPEFSGLLPLDVVAWTSARNGYAGKLFEVAEVAVDPLTLAATLSLREVDPADYDWSPGDLLATGAPSSVLVLPGLAPLPGFSVSPIAITDATGNTRRPGLLLGWPTTLTGIAQVAWQVRVQATGAVVAEGSTANVEAGRVVLSEGLLPATAYEARGRGLGRDTDWTGWIAATTPDARLSLADIDAYLTGVLEEHRSLLDELVVAPRLAELRADASLDDVAEDRLESLLYARKAQDGQAADFAYVREESHAQVTEAREAIATVRSEVGAAIDAIEATVFTELAARASDTEAIALAVTQLDARTATAEAQVQQAMIAVADIQGNASASYSLRVGAGGAAGTFQIVASDDVDGPPLSGIRLAADLITLDGAAIVDELITSGSRVTVPAGVRGGAEAPTGVSATAMSFGSSQVVAELAVQRVGQMTFLTFTIQVGAGASGADLALIFWVMRSDFEGTEEIDSFHLGQGSKRQSHTLTTIDGKLASGPATYTVRVARLPANSGAPQFHQWTLSAFQFVV